MGVVGLVFRYVSIFAAAIFGAYTVIMLLTQASFQSHVIYLHKIQMTWFKDLDSPEQFGFLHNQKRGNIACGTLWTGFGFTSRLAFKLLRDDPEARLILHLHGAAGTVGSGYRTPNYRALSAGDPEKIHVLTFDYRGFGKSPDTPSERGLILDALAVADWAMNVAGIPPSRILIFAQSLGTAVTLGVSEHLALQFPPIVFAGTILVAPFADVSSLMATYKVAGTIPIVSPLARFPKLFNYLQALTYEKWRSKDQIESYDDYDIPWHHTQTVFWHAVKGSVPQGISLEELDAERLRSERDLGAAGSVMQWKTENGIIREEIIKHGLHDVVMGYTIVTMAVMRMLAAAEDA